MNCRIFAIACIVIALRCSVAPLTGGSDNPDFKVAGVIIDSTGMPAQNTLVKLIPGAYDAAVDAPLPDSLTKTTDELGRYVLHAPGKGTYTIQTECITDKTRALVFGVSVSRDSTFVPNIVLKRPGTIKVFLPDSVDHANGYLYIPGSDIFRKLNGANGFVVLDSVPAGLIPSISYSSTNSNMRNVIRSDITVSSDDTTVVAMPLWTYAKTLYLNTTASGAAVAGMVSDFPVLVRLSSGNFDFAKDKTGGRDLRFAKPDQTPLSFEIERWDSADGLAEIWVKVDTVYGNDNTHYIVMYYGASPGLIAPSLSNGAAVFDTNAGFQGVWHLNDAQGQTVRDATANHFEGTPSDTAPASVPGMIGAGMQFNGTTSYIRITGTASGKLNFPESGNYTVSSWVYMETLVDTMTEVIVAKGNEDYFLKMYFGPAGDGPRWEFGEFQEASGHWINRVPPVTVNAWKHLTGVRNGLHQDLYIDGLLANDVPGVGIGDTSEHRDESHDVYIGRYPENVIRNFQNYCYWRGMLDEVQISNVSRGADWIKLSSMNQRPDNKLVVFK
jgi:hypothetical protein